MAHPNSKDRSTGDHKEDLSTILSTKERVELTLLIANITEVMRKQIADTFNASIVTSKQFQQVLQVTDRNPNVDESQPKEETEEEAAAQKLREKREKELSAPKMLELKKDSLEFFDRWRESIHSRIGEVVNNPKDVTEQQLEKASTEATPDTAPAEPKVLRKFLLVPHTVMGSIEYIRYIKK
jgi:hypothetical protein